MLTLRILILCLGLSLGTPSLAVDPLSSSRYAEYGDWLIGCDNAGDCEAIGFDDTNTDIMMNIQRKAGPNGDMKLLIARASTLSISNVSADNKVIKMATADWTVVNEKEQHEVYSTKPSAILGFINHIRQASQLQIDRHSEAAAPLSLNGLSAALLFMDEIQGRIDSQNAFVRKGKKPENLVPSAKPLPKLRAAPYRGKKLSPEQEKRIAKIIREQKAAVFKQDDCMQGEFVGFDAVRMLSKNRLLALLECNRGAYQSYYLIFHAPLDNPKKAIQVKLPMPPGTPPESSIGNAEYDEDTANLHAYGKGRGLFDCGDISRWTFDGNNFHLASYSLQQRCGGLGIGEFPVLWKTQ
jgi:Protein of unknown function (DUF1176)